MSMQDAVVGGGDHLLEAAGARAGGRRSSCAPSGGGCSRRRGPRRRSCRGPRGRPSRVRRGRRPRCRRARCRPGAPACPRRRSRSCPRAPGRVASAVMFMRSLPKRKRADLRQVEPGGSGEGGLPAEDAVELDGVADRLVDLERHLLGADDEVDRRRGSGTRGAVSSARASSAIRGALPGQVELAHELPAARPVLAADARVAAPLRLGLAVGGRVHRARRTRRCAGRCGDPRCWRATSSSPRCRSWRSPCRRRAPSWRGSRRPAGRPSRPAAPPAGPRATSLAHESLRTSTGVSSRSAPGTDALARAMAAAWAPGRTSGLGREVGGREEAPARSR